MGYSLSHGTYPTFVLNALLLPLNAWRLHQMIDLVRGIDAAIKSDMNVDWLLKYMRPKHYKAGDIMMARGEYATEAFYIVSGEVSWSRSTRPVARGRCSARSDCSRPTGSGS